jgi:hypothetical protein
MTSNSTDVSMNIMELTEENIAAKNIAENIAEKNLETLISLKFATEKEFNILGENFKKIKELRLEGNVCKDLDIYEVYNLYQKNIKNYGDDFLEQQMILIKQIDDLLRKKCEHIWIDDVIDGPFSSRNYCYCANCYITK